MKIIKLNQTEKLQSSLRNLQHITQAIKCLCCDYATNEQYESELYPEIKIEEDGDGFIFENLKEKEE